MALTAAYAQGGFRRANPRNHWSALDEAGGRVALTVRSDRIVKTPEPAVLEMRDDPRLDLRPRKPGNTVRKKPIGHGIDRCAGRFHLILVRAVDPGAGPRKVDRACWWHRRIGRIAREDVDAETGAFRMTLVPA